MLGEADNARLTKNFSKNPKKLNHSYCGNALQYGMIKDPREKLNRTFYDAYRIIPVLK
jgi:hypothetical protein